MSLPVASFWRQTGRRATAILDAETSIGYGSCVCFAGMAATFLTSGGFGSIEFYSKRRRGGLIRSCTSSRSVHSRATRCSVSVRVYWRDSMENCSARYVSCHHSFPFQARLIPGQACLYAFHTRTSLQSRAGQRGRFCRVATADAAVRSEAR